MSREQVLLVVGAGMLLLLAIVWSRAHVAEAVDHREVVYGQLIDVHEGIAELDRLATTRDAVPSERRPDSDLLGDMRAALRRSGIAEQALVAVEHRDDRLLEGSSVRVQRVQVRLVAVGVAEIGRFLSAWREAGSPWRVVESQWVHDQDSQGSRYSVTFLFAAPYLALSSQ